MKIILWLVLNDLRRDWKRPWSTLLLISLPLVLSVLIASVFGGKSGSGPMPTVHIAILDQDQDMLTGMLRSLPGQGAAADVLRVHFVESREEGLRLVEKSEVSALVVLPEHMTEYLLAGRTNSIDFYENPSQQLLPKVVWQGLSLVTVGLSGAAETLGEPLRDIRALIRSNDLPLGIAVGTIASNSVQKIRGMRTYLFPPLVQFKTVNASDFVPFLTNITTSAPVP